MSKQYLSSNEIVEDFFSKMQPEWIKQAAELTPDDLIQYHSGTGRAIRNEYHLWDENNPYTDASDPEGYFHPDQLSFVIMRAIVDKCKHWVRENVDAV
jgi:hypothetical protein